MADVSMLGVVCCNGVRASYGVGIYGFGRERGGGQKKLMDDHNCE